MVGKKISSDGKTLVEIFTEISQGNRGIVFIEDGREDKFVSYSNLYQRSLTILYNLQQRGVRPGNELLFQVPDNFDFITIFWACLLGGIIPVPVTMAKNDSFRYKLFKIWENLKQPYLVVTQNFSLNLETFAAKTSLNDTYDQMNNRKLLIEELESSQGKGDILLPDEQDIAFIQFSSGSTSDPKGVVLTHKNLITNIRDIAMRIKTPSTGEKILSWMPLTHDMGMILLYLFSVVMVCDLYLMLPNLFIYHPLLWLEKIDQYKINMVGMPNFGFKHLLKFYKGDKSGNIDLSSIRIIMNGAEPVSLDLCHRFMNAMEPLGLKRNTMVPAYGMAEASVGISVPEPEDIVEVSVDRNHLNLGEKVKEINSKLRYAVNFVEVGKHLVHCRLRIADQSDVEVGDRVVGHIQIQGENVTSGYYNNPEATEKAMTADGWLRTGDLGFLRDGKLVIMGRFKDIIFVNGLNYYAHDLEFVCDWLEGFDLREIAVCGVYNPDLQMDEVLCFVVFRGHLEEFLPLMERLKKHLVQQIGIGISQIIPIKGIPITTSGKKQRYRLKEAYQRGEYDAIIQKLLELQRELAG